MANASQHRKILLFLCIHPLSCRQTADKQKYHWLKNDSFPLIERTPRYLLPSRTLPHRVGCLPNKSLQTPLILSVAKLPAVCLLFRIESRKSENCSTLLFFPENAATSGSPGGQGCTVRRHRTEQQKNSDGVKANNDSRRRNGYFQTLFYQVKAISGRSADS